MSSTIRHKSKYFHCTVKRAKDRLQKFHFCRLPFDVTSSLISLLVSSLPQARAQRFAGICAIINGRVDYIKALFLFDEGTKVNKEINLQVNKV